MRNHVAFQTQLASIMEALAKAAVTEIRKLVEDGSFELRLEVSRSHKEINRLMSKLQQVEGELRKAQEAATREIRSVGVQAEEQFKGAAGGTGAVKCGTDAFVEQLDEKKCKAQTCNRRPGFGYVVKEEEQEEEHEAPILHQTESEDSAGRLNNVASEYVMFEMDPQLWRSFTEGDSDVTDDPVCSNVTEQCLQSQSVLSPVRHTPATMETSGSTLSCLGKDSHVLDGGFMKEEAGGQCLYRSEMGGTQVREHEQPRFSKNDNLTSQVFRPVQQQLDLQMGVTENRTDTVSSCNQNARIPRCGRGEKHHSCALCQKSFNHFSTLVRHQRVHTGEKPFICVECGKRFTSRSNLIRHERVHTGNKPFDCAQCGRRFSLRCNLIRHERIHTGNKPFGCVQCGKRFARGSNLREHNRIHTGERPYHCTQCGKSFTQFSGLKSHLKTHSRNDFLELCKT